MGHIATLDEFQPNPNDNQVLRRLEDEAHNQWTSHRCLAGANDSRSGAMMETSANQHSQGDNEHPEDLKSAVSMVQNWQDKAHKKSQHNPNPKPKGKGDDGGNEASFAQKGDKKKPKGPSKENPCSCCGADDHWIRECPLKKKHDEEKRSNKQGGNQQSHAQQGSTNPSPPATVNAPPSGNASVVGTPGELQHWATSNCMVSHMMTQVGVDMFQHDKNT